MRRRRCLPTLVGAHADRRRRTGPVAHARPARPPVARTRVRAWPGRCTRRPRVGGWLGGRADALRGGAARWPSRPGSPRRRRRLVGRMRCAGDLRRRVAGDRRCRVPGCSALALGGATGRPGSGCAAGAAAARPIPLRAWRDAPFFPTPARRAAGPAGPRSRCPPRACARRRLRPWPWPGALHRCGRRRSCAGVEWSAAAGLAARAALRRRAARRAPAATCGPRRGPASIWSMSSSAPRAWPARLRQGQRANWRPGPGWSAWTSRCPGRCPWRRCSWRLHGRARRPLWIYRPRSAAFAAPIPRLNRARRSAGGITRPIARAGTGRTAGIAHSGSTAHVRHHRLGRRPGLHLRRVHRARRQHRRDPARAAVRDDHDLRRGARRLPGQQPDEGGQGHAGAAWAAASRAASSARRATWSCWRCCTTSCRRRARKA